MSDLEEEDLIDFIEKLAGWYLDNIGNTIALLERIMPYVYEERQKMIPDLKELRELRAAQELSINEYIANAKEKLDG